MIFNKELNVSLLNKLKCVQTLINVFQLSTFKCNESLDTNIYLQAQCAVYCKYINTNSKY